MFPVDKHYDQKNAAPKSGNAELNRQAEVPERKEKGDATEKLDKRHP
jgi:hypothetical protein